MRLSLPNGAASADLLIRLNVDEHFSHKLAKPGDFEPGLFVGLPLSRDRHLEHAIALVGEQIIGFLDLFEFEAMRD